jgi:actin-like ATPase involved in cell morphogenesis
VYVTGTEGHQADDSLDMDHHQANVSLHIGQGRPDLAVIIANEVRQASPDRVAVLVCGPESMRAQVLRVCGRHN